MQALPITSLLAAAAAIFLVLLSFPIANHRRAARISMGDGGDDRFSRLIRTQANFIEYVPLGILLTGLLEYGGAPFWQVATTAGLLAAGRVLHPIGMLSGTLPARASGVILTFASLLFGAGVLLWRIFTA